MLCIRSVIRGPATGTGQSLTVDTYVPGEAPEEGAIFRQRSRWCKGHIQVCVKTNMLLLLRSGLAVGPISFVYIPSTNCGYLSKLKDWP